MAKTCPVCNGPVSVMRRSDFCSKDCAAGIGRVRSTTAKQSRFRVDRTHLMVEQFFCAWLRRHPRVATIEAGHIKRAATFKEGRRRPNLSQKQIEELQRAVAEEREMRESEYRVRWDVYHELDLEMLSAITIEVPDIVDVWEGRCIFASGIGNDERSSVGIDRIKGNRQRSSSMQQIAQPELERRWELLAPRFTALHPARCPECFSEQRSEPKFVWKETAFGSDGVLCINKWHNEEQKHGE